ncbi:MAG: hypothetical protein QXS20_10135, partial [Candidatus Thorarchaeota archaeon]
MVEEKIKLKVTAAQPKDHGRSIVRLNSDTRHALNIRSGDFVLLKGNKETVAICWPALKEDDILDIVRIDGL